MSGTLTLKIDKNRTGTNKIMGRFLDLMDTILKLRYAFGSLQSFFTHRDKHLQLHGIQTSQLLILGRKQVRAKYIFLFSLLVSPGSGQ